MGKVRRGLGPNQVGLEGRRKRVWDVSGRGRWLASITLPAVWGMVHEEGWVEGRTNG